MDLVMFLVGHVVTQDSTALPNNVLVERICNNHVRQQVYASLRGEFSMQLGSNVDSVVDATAEPALQNEATMNPTPGGIPRQKLANCELRASSSGFRSDVISLVDLGVSGGTIGTVDVGAIVVERVAKIAGATLSAAPFKAPDRARKAYEKGLAAEKNNKLADACKDFQRAVVIYPNYAHAWFQLGTVLEKEGEKDEARAAFTRATTIDSKFLPPYLSLASMAYEAQNWIELLTFTGHILSLDPWNQRDFTGYMLDLDSVNYAQPYFYNALANYKLNRIEEAEKSAIKAEQLELSAHYPQVHLLMADILARKSDYPGAISELQTYLQLAPRVKESNQLQKQLAEWKKLNGSVSTSEKTDQN